MISRRNIRVKVMQIIYATESMQDAAAMLSPTKTVRKQINQTQELFAYLLRFILGVASYAETDSRNRMAKNLVTEKTEMSISKFRATKCFGK